MQLRRFYLPTASVENASLELDEIQSRHVRKVLRLSVGDFVQAFNGIGGEFECRIRSFGKKTVSVEVLRETRPASPESPLDLRLGIPLIKPANAELILQKAVELGVTTVVPVLTARCETKASKWNPERWQKIIVESSKQCGRATLLKLDNLKNFEDFADDSEGARFLFSESDGSHEFPDKIPAAKITLAIGPEGGWDLSEIELAKSAGFSIIHLGGRILRAETAAIVFTGIVQHRYGDMK